jgi:hypothetical protein
MEASAICGVTEGVQCFWRKLYMCVIIGICVEERWNKSFY